MFAAGRILRNRCESAANGEVVGGLSLFVKRTKKKRRPFRCYFPFVWQAVLASFIGVTIIIGGTIMCAIGYNAAQFSNEHTDVQTDVPDNATEKRTSSGWPSASEKLNKKGSEQV